MATSLAAQLQKLALPQTGALQRDKSRASLLFDPKVAASIDRETFYDIGISGLKELEKYNPEFASFENSLFSATSRDVERSVENKVVNLKLDKTIQKFLCMLSPYFIVKPAHKALEWLIHRFSIHEYNREDLLKLILPYHETNVFTKCVQLFNVRESNDSWNWLRPLQKNGIHLPRVTLFNHCASDVGFLKMIGQMTIDAVDVNGPRATSLTTLFSFYCTTTIGALEHSESVTEPQISAILPALLKGLSSDIPDFTASSYMITAELLRKTKLTPKALNRLVYKIAKNDTHLRMEATVLLLLVYQTQIDVFDSVPDKAMDCLAKGAWFPANLGKLVSGGCHVMPLLVPVLKNALQNASDESVRLFINSLIDEVRLNDDGATVLINTVLDNCSLEDDADSTDVKLWFSNTLKTLETRYPNAFDAVAGQVMSSKNSQKRRRALRCIMNFVMSSNQQQGNIDIFEKLYHPNALFRADAIKYLIANYDSLQPKDKDMLRGVIAERFFDDDIAVVTNVFALSVKNLTEWLGEEGFTNILVRLLSKHQNNREWASVVDLALRILCGMGNSAKVFLAVVPYLFPIVDAELGVAQRVVQSRFGGQYPMLVGARKKLMKITRAQDFCDVVYDVFRRESIDDEFLSEIRENLDGADAIHKYIYCVLLTQSLSGCDPEKSLDVMEVLSSYLCDVSVVKKGVSAHAYISVARSGKFPLQGLLDCAKLVVDRTDVSVADKWLDFACDDPAMKYIVKMYVTLVSGCGSPKPKIVKLYSEGLKHFLNRPFPTYRNKLEFFANFLAVTKYDSSVTPAVQIQSALALAALLDHAKEPLSWVLEFDSIVVPAVLIGLSNDIGEVREASMNVLIKLANAICLVDAYHPLLQKLVKHKQEILLSSDQLALILYNVLTGDFGKPILAELVRIGSDPSVPRHVNSKVLDVLVHIGDDSTVRQMARLGVHVLKSVGPEDVLDCWASNVLRNVIQGYSKFPAAYVRTNTPLWDFLVLALSADVVVLDTYACPAVLMLEQITKEFFAYLDDSVKKLLVVRLADMATKSENADVVVSVNKVVKRIHLDVALIMDGLSAMRDVKSAKVRTGRRSRTAFIVPTADILDTIEWRTGITYLEFIQDKKKLSNTSLLLPVLFAVLKKCLDFDEQSSVEYAKQLLLSSILHCCEKIQAESEVLSENVFNMELVVQCIRASQNPQTHYHALLVLAHAATFIPDQVLHNIMAIFTFMGSSVLRHDDAYSFQIISKIIDSVIPILVVSRDEANIVNVLRVFVDVILDVPEHRRMPLFTKLLSTLGVEDCLWLFLILVFESHVNHGNEKQTPTKRLDIAANITLEFDPQTVIRTSIKLVQYLKSLPVEKDDAAVAVDLFNIKKHTPKQFRHFKYTVVTFVSNLLSSKRLVNQIATLDTQEAQEMEPLYKDVIVCTLTYLQATSKVLDKNAGTPQTQYWKVMVHHTYDILDSINALLTTDMFLLVVQGLLSHNILTVRRKAMELLNQKLQYQPSFFYESADDYNVQDKGGLLALLPSLLSILKSIHGQNAEPEHELNQQTALLSLKLLVKMLAAKSPDKFTPVLYIVTDLIKSERARGNILASVVLCLAELCANLRAHAICGLVKFMPALLKVLRQQRQEETPTLLLTCLITATQKIVESLPLFLSPYLEKLLIILCSLSAKWSQDDNGKLNSFLNKLKTIRAHIGKTIPPRILVPIIGDAYATIVAKEQHDAVGPLMDVLSVHLGSIRGPDLSAQLPELNKFFLAALGFRADNPETTPAVLDGVETHVIQALTTLVLKLSETSFRPFYYKLYDWAVHTENKSERVITFYSLSHGIAESLKGLFVLFAGHFVGNAATLLAESNPAKTETTYFDDDAKCVRLTENIVKTLRSVFLYDSQNFVDRERFETLMQPLVDHLENVRLGARIKDLLIPCVAQFAVAAADDALWKQLNYQILLKTRHESATVRLVALECACSVASLLGEDFLPLLPETIPFLAELLEDEDEAVEAACRVAVQGLEKVLGEPLQKYF